MGWGVGTTREGEVVYGKLCMCGSRGRVQGFICMCGSRGRVSYVCVVVGAGFHMYVW